MKTYVIFLSSIYASLCFTAEMPHITNVHTGILPYTIRNIGDQFKVMLLLKSEIITLDDQLGTRVLIWSDFGGEVGALDNKDTAAIDYFLRQTHGILNCDGKKDDANCIALQKKKMIADMEYENRMIDFYKQTGRTGILPISAQYYTIRLAKVEYIAAEQLTQILRGGYAWVSADDFLNQIKLSYAQSKDYKRVKFGSDSLKRAFAYTLLNNFNKVQSQIQTLKESAARTAWQLGFTSDPAAHPAIRSLDPETNRTGRWTNQAQAIEQRSEYTGSSTWEHAKANVGMSWENTKTNLRVFFNWIKNYWSKPNK